jgi:hypothetical protein
VKLNGLFLCKRPKLKYTADKEMPLPWEQRLQIAYDSALGMVQTHPFEISSHETIGYLLKINYIYQGYPIPHLLS